MTTSRYRHRELGYEVEAEQYSAFRQIPLMGRYKFKQEILSVGDNCVAAHPSLVYSDDFHGFVAYEGDYIVRVVNGDPWPMRIDAETFATLYEEVDTTVADGSSSDAGESVEPVKEFHHVELFIDGIRVFDSQIHAHESRPR